MKNIKGMKVIDYISLVVLIVILSVIAWVLFRNLWLQQYGSDTERGAAGYIILEPIFNFPMFVIMAGVVAIPLNFLRGKIPLPLIVLAGSLVSPLLIYIIMSISGA